MGQLALIAGIPSFGAALGELLLVDAGPGASLPDLKTALEGVQAMIALLVAFLAFGRLRRTGRVSDGLLLAGFLVLASNSVFVVVDVIVTPGTPPADGLLWARILLRVTGTALVAVAALLPPRQAIEGHRWQLAVVVAGVVVVAIALTIAEDHLPAAGRQAPHGIMGVPLLRGALAIQLLLSSLAAVGFLRAARRSADSFLTALAVGYVVHAASSVAFVGRPSLYASHVHVGDLLRVGACAAKV